MIRRISPGGTTRPVGLFGELTISSFVLSVIGVANLIGGQHEIGFFGIDKDVFGAAERSDLRKRDPIWTRYQKTSSPGSRIVHAALKIPCFPPHAATTWPGENSGPEPFRVK